MESGIITLLWLMAIVLLLGPIIIAIVALVMANANERKLREQQAMLALQQEQLAQLTARVRMLDRGVRATEAPTPTPTVAAPAPVKTWVAPAPADTLPAPLIAEARPALPSQHEPGEIEENLGKRWITWGGVLALFLSVTFFVKYAIENNWIGPTGRIVLGLLFGLALLIAGDMAVRRTWRALGEGLMGGGLAICYAVLYAAFALYHFLPAPAAFLFMVLFTAAGMTLAVLHDAFSLGALAVLGGLLTPALISTGENARDVLFAYLLLLDLGVLGVAFFKRWRALDLLAFLGSWLLVAGWMHGFYSETQLIPSVIWLCLLYLVFLALPFVYHLYHGESITIERFVLALLNGGVAYGTLYYLLAPHHRPAVGFIALGMSATSLALGSITRHKWPRDAAPLFGFITMSVAFLTIAVPLMLSTYNVALAWAIIGPALCYLGYRFRYYPVRVGAIVILLLAIIKFFTDCWPLHTGHFIPLLNWRFFGAMLLPLIIAGYTVIQHLWRKEASDEDETLKLISAVGAWSLAIFFLQAEMWQWLEAAQLLALAHVISSVLWAVGGLVLVLSGLRIRNLAVQIVGIFPLIIAIILLLMSYQQNVSFPVLYLNPRFGGCALVVLALFFSWWLAYRRNGNAELQQVLFAAAEGSALLFLSLEGYQWGSLQALHGAHAEWMAQLMLSLTWGVFALALLAAGFARRSRGMRITALCCFGITVLKLLIVDLATLEQIYRIISCFVIGLLLIGASYLYHRIEKRLQTTESVQEDQLP